MKPNGIQGLAIEVDFHLTPVRPKLPLPKTNVEMPSPSATSCPGESPQKIIPSPATLNP